MTSTVSNYKNKFSAAFKIDFKRNLPGFVTLLVISLIIPILSIIINYSYNFVFGTSSSVIQSTEDITFEAMTISGVMTIICGLYSIIGVPEIFKEIFKKQACDHFFAIPVKRDILFSAKFLVGFISNIAAFALSNAFFVITMLSISNSVKTYKIEAQPYLLTMAGTLLAVLAIYSVFVVCAVTSGKRFQYIVLSAISLLCVSGVISGIVLNLNKIWGNFIEIKYLSAISAVENSINCFIYSSEMNYKPILIFIAISLIEIIAAFAVGFITFKKRKAETAEVAPTDKVLPYVFLSVLTASSFLLHTSYQNPVIAIVAGTLFAAAMGMLFTGIFYKKVFTKQTAATTISVIVVCAIISGGTALPVYSKYINNIPEASQVESVEFSNLNPSSDFSGLLNIINSGSLSYEADHTFKIKSPEAVEKTIELHKALTDENIINASKQQFSISLIDYVINSGKEEYFPQFSCQIIYTLKSGRKIKRTYPTNVANNSRVVDAFAELMRSEEISSKIKPLNIDKEDFLFAKVEGNYSDILKAFVGYSESPITQSETDEVFTYNRTMLTEDFDIDKYKEAYTEDMNRYENQAFVRTLFLRSGIGFDPDINYVPYSEAYSLILFSIKEGTDEKIKEELKSLSYKEFDEMYTAHIYDSNLNPEAERLFSHIDEFSVTISYEDVSMLSYLSSLGINLI